MQDKLNTEIIKKAKDIKLIISDLDGTLLDANSQLSENTLATVKELREKDYLFTIATGRLDKMSWKFAKQLDLDLPIISCNGAMLRYLGSEEVLYQYFLPNEAVMKIAKCCLEGDADLLLYSAETVYYTSNSQRIKSFHRYNNEAVERGLEAINLVCFDTLHSLPPEDSIMKAFVVYPQDEMAKVELGKCLETIDGVERVVSVVGSVDIVPEHCNKGDAVRRLAESLGLDLGQVCTLGDQMNDISMLKISGLSVGMQGGADAIFEHVDYIAEDHDKDGFAIAMRNIFLS